MIDLAEVRIVLVSAIVGALIGAAYTFVAHHAPVVGLLIGAAFGTVFPTIEMLLFKGEAGARLRRSPFLVFLGVRIAVYLVLIVAIEVSSVWLFYGRAAIGEIGAADVGFALLISFLFNLLHAVADLLGPGVLFAFAAGRYHRPRPEERALLFIDLCGSTAKAERLGEARFLDFLDAFLADVSRDIVENGGEIHKYVGDEIIATWRLKNGRDNAGIVRAYLAARDRLAARREAYRREFGEGAEFRAAMHIGVVVLGEVGSFKKEIALIGDAMNTAARILDACRALNRPALASLALVKRVGVLPSSVRSDAIAPLTLRGKAEPLELVALEPA
jgi:adenylate cyclase